MSAGQVLHVGDKVRPEGPVRCSERVERHGRMRVCGGLVGAPAVGSVLVEVESAAVLEACDDGWRLRCASCGAWYRFARLTSPRVVARFGIDNQGRHRVHESPPESPPEERVLSRSR